MKKVLFFIIAVAIGMFFMRSCEWAFNSPDGYPEHISHQEYIFWTFIGVVVCVIWIGNQFWNNKDKEDKK